MPFYEYGCPICGAKKEVQHPMSEIGKIEVLCDHCNQPMKKMVSMPSLIGFDEIGRSIGRKEQNESPKTETPRKDKPAESTPKKEEAA